MTRLPTWIFPLWVFLTGASILIIEIVAVRVLSPYYGNTVFTVSSIISTILLALSVGYWVGGSVADRYPTPRPFFLLILAGGGSLLFTCAVAATALPHYSLALSPVWGPLIFSILLFLLPAFLLGMLSPYAVKLQSLVESQVGIGTIAGKMFFWSTLGSISGSVAAGFWLIPQFGVDLILTATGIGLVLLGGLPLLFWDQPRNRNHRLATVALVIGFPIGFISLVPTTPSDMLYVQDGVYEKITIVDGEYRGRPTRFFYQDKSSSGAMYLDTDDPLDLAYDYTRAYSLYRPFVPEVREALVIGGGVYSIPKALLQALPEATVTVAEIEPSLPTLAETYFDLPRTARLQHSTEDGRRLLAAREAQYDFIVSDVYYSLFSIPIHFTTREFFELAKSRLSSEGVVVLNLIGSLSHQSPSLILSEIKTFRQVFPNSFFIAVNDPGSKAMQNIIAVGSRADTPLDVSRAHLAQYADPWLMSVPDRLIDLARFDWSQPLILTDDYAPVDAWMATAAQADRTRMRGLDGQEMLALIETQLAFGPRFLDSPGHQKTQAMLAGEMRPLADTVLIDRFTAESVSGQVYPLTNIIARFHPERERRILLGTHYDSKRLANLDEQFPDHPVPGANDSASGVAVLIELARVLKDEEVLQGDVGVDLIFFDGEEGAHDIDTSFSHWQPFGSTRLAQELPTYYPKRLPELAVIIDMVCDRNLVLKPELSSLASAPEAVAQLWRIGHSLYPDSFDVTPGPHVLDDHTPLQAAGIPSLLMIDTLYPPFHTTHDTLDQCSAQSLEVVGRTLERFLRGMAGTV